MPEVNVDKVNAALIAAKRWQKELAFAKDLQEAAEAVLSAAAAVRDADDRKEAAERKRELAEKAAEDADQHRLSTDAAAEDAKKAAALALKVAREEADYQVALAKNAAEKWYLEAQARISEASEKFEKRKALLEADIAALEARKSKLVAEIEEMRRKFV